VSRRVYFGLHVAGFAWYVAGIVLMFNVSWWFAPVAAAGITFFVIVRLTYSEARRGHRRDHQVRGDSGSSEDPGRPTQYLTKSQYLALSGTGSRSRQGAGPSLTLARSDEEPIRGWKHAQVIGPDEHGRLTFIPMNGGTSVGPSLMSYGVEDVAKCGLGQPHHVPDPGCLCGFYAHRDGVTSPAWTWGREPFDIYALLEVELYGRVVEGSQGLRAEKQRVLSVTVRAACSQEAIPDQVVHTSMQYMTSSFNPTPRAVRCQNHAGFVDSAGQLLCAAHALRSRVRFFEWEPAPVNCETEWRWAR
jgi:hypothetical protein